MTQWNTVSQLEIYPYTGGRTQADYPVRPNFKTGDHGFMVDFDLDRPPLEYAGLRMVSVR
jgi:hypothetical protein